MRSFLTAFLAAAAVAGGAAAQDGRSYPRMTGGAEDSTVAYGPGPQNNVVGGGGAVLWGFGDEQVLRHADAGFAHRAPGNRVAVASGDEGRVAWVELPEAAPATMLASRR